MLRIRFEPATARRYGNAMTYSRQYVLKRTAGGDMIKNFVGRHERKAIPFRPLPQPFFLRDFFFPPVARNHAVNAIGERVSHLTGNFIELAFTHDQTSIAAPERQKSRRMAAHFVPTDGALPFFRAQSPLGQEPAKVYIAGAIPDQKNHHGTVIDANLRADDEL